eukprot:COSAG01_NODE_52673_length_345_cov_0.613821_1_plen_61_part_10
MRACVRACALDLGALEHGLADALLLVLEAVVVPADRVQRRHHLCVGGVVLLGKLQLAAVLE